jgi:hypothetical protein
MTTLAAAGATCTAAAERLVEASSDWSVDLEAAAMTLSYGTGSNGIGPHSRWGLSVAPSDRGVEWGIELRLGWSISW